MTITFETLRKIKENVYEDRFGQPFKSEDELKKKVKTVWSEVAQDLPEIRKALKQFAPRLLALKKRVENASK